MSLLEARQAAIDIQVKDPVGLTPKSLKMKKK